jgi:uncharacterized protein (TIGR00251 family)
LPGPDAVSDVVSIREGGIRFALRVTPRGGRDAIEGWQKSADGQQALKLRVRAPAEDGKANEAVIGLLAAALDVPRRDVALVTGSTGRRKLVEIAGEPASLVDRLKTLWGVA